MTDSTLWTSIRGHVSTHPELRECSQAEAERVQRDVLARYRIREDAIWWWDNLGVDAEVVPYDSYPISRDWMAAAEAYLLVSDDGPWPWPMVKGRVRDLTELVLEQCHFEYALVAVDASWVVFDTHHNELVLAGTVPDRAHLIATTLETSSAAIS